MTTSTTTQDTELLAALKDVLCLARLKYGNLDPDANKVFESAEALISSSSSAKAVDGENSARAVPQQLDGWQPIETAPRDGRQPLLLIGRYPNNAAWSDIYHGWWNGDGWSRWPHSFKPTHWHAHSTPKTTHPPVLGTAREILNSAQARGEAQ